MPTSKGNEFIDYVNDPTGRREAFIPIVLVSLINHMDSSNNYFVSTYDISTDFRAVYVYRKASGRVVEKFRTQNITKTHELLNNIDTVSIGKIRNFLYLRPITTLSSPKVDTPHEFTKYDKTNKTIRFIDDILLCPEIDWQKIKRKLTAEIDEHFAELDSASL